MTNVEELFEEWRDIPKYEGIYQASNLGRIRSLDKRVKSRWGKFRLIKGRILKYQVSNRGYCRVELNNQRKAIIFSVHSLVLLAFVGDRPDGNVCLHLNDIKTDNRLVNLRWDTQSENIKDSYKKGNAASLNKRPVIAVHLDTNEIVKFNSVKNAKKTLGGGVDKVLKGTQKHTKNYTLKYSTYEDR